MNQKPVPKIFPLRCLPAIVPLLFLAMSLSLQAQKKAGAPEISIQQQGDSLNILIDGELFTANRTDLRLPMLYPIVGPHGIGMTRNYPMKEGVKDEASDHPHHTSLWYTHGIVNGKDFWHGKENRIEQTKVTQELKNNRAILRTENVWISNEDLVLKDRRIMQFFVTEQGARAIDFSVTLQASGGDVVFGDTKEGSMGFRMHPKLKLKGGGKVINSEGVEGKGVWGKAAKWICYHGQIDGHRVGATICDHPDNPRHPTTWHARDYGLVAANPYGLSYFQKKPKGSGDLKIPKDKSVTFRYRFLFHEGDAASAGIDQEFKAFATE